MLFLFINGLFSLFFLLGIFFLISFYTLFEKRALYMYLAFVFTIGPLLSFSILYRYEKNIYNLPVHISVIVFMLIFFCVFIYLFSTSHCLCDMDQRCVGNQCISRKPQPHPDHSGTVQPHPDHGGTVQPHPDHSGTVQPSHCPLCDNKECCGVCTSVTVNVDGVENKQELCCPKDQIIVGDGGMSKCCGGGQKAVPEKTGPPKRCGSQCGGVYCKDNELCQTIKRKDGEDGESQVDFETRIKSLLKEMDYHIENDSVLFCTPKTKCQISFHKRKPENSDYFYLDDGKNTACLKDLESNECTNATQNSIMYYSGKASEDAFSAYNKMLVEKNSECTNPEKGCLHQAIRTAGATYSIYDPSTNTCNMLISGNQVPSFKNRNLIQNEKCNNGSDLCLEYGRVFENSGFKLAGNVNDAYDIVCPPPCDDKDDGKKLEEMRNILGNKCIIKSIKDGGVYGMGECTKQLCTTVVKDTDPYGFIDSFDNTCNNGGNCNSTFDSKTNLLSRNCVCAKAWKGKNCNDKE